MSQKAYLVTLIMQKYSRFYELDSIIQTNKGAKFVT